MLRTLRARPATEPKNAFPYADRNDTSISSISSTPQPTWRAKGSSTTRERITNAQKHAFFQRVDLTHMLVSMMMMYTLGGVHLRTNKRATP